MDQERFDKVALALSRRRIVGGALAGLLGVSAAKVAEVAAKGDKKGKAKRNNKKKGKAEATCNPNPCPPGFCCTETPPGSGPSCTDFATQIATGTVCGSDGGGGFSGGGGDFAGGGASGRW